MITHSVEWYESKDGQIFADEMDCMAHEVNLLYRESGVRFYIRDEEIQELIVKEDKSYNEMTDIFIDWSKMEENEAFLQAVRNELGWCGVEYALKGNGTHYQFTECGDLLEVK